MHRCSGTIRHMLYKHVITDRSLAYLSKYLRATRCYWSPCRIPGRLAMLDHLFSGLTSLWHYVLVASTLVFLLHNYFNKGLQKYPGPFFASLTDWWRFFAVASRKPQFIYRRLHDEHGEIVRLGPNALSFSSPEAVKAIYGLNNKLNKVRTSFDSSDRQSNSVTECILSSSDADVKRRSPAVLVWHTGSKLSRKIETDGQQCILYEHFGPVRASSR